jgi:DNA-binding Lrp family transcriptional regulator
LIIDFHHKKKGCVMFDSTIADKLGIAERTVIRRRQELEKAGYIREVNGRNRRELLPTAPDSSVISDDTDDERGDTSVRWGGDTGVTDREIDNPEGTRESAPARGGASRFEVDPRSEPPEEVFSALVDIWRSVSTAPPLNARFEKVLIGWAKDEKIPDLDLFRQVLEREAANTTAKGSGLNPGILLQEYRDQLQSGKLEPWQQEDEHWTVNEEGKVCFKGVPVEETGPQNLAKQSKDGAPGPAPELSAHG